MEKANDMGPCTICKQPGFRGYRLPGLFSEQAVKGYRWYCGDHIADGEAAYLAAINPIPHHAHGRLHSGSQQGGSGVRHEGGSPDRDGSKGVDARDPEQGKLF